SDAGDGARGGAVAAARRSDRYRDVHVIFDGAQPGGDAERAYRDSARAAGGMHRADYGEDSGGAGAAGGRGGVGVYGGGAGAGDEETLRGRRSMMDQHHLGRLSRVDPRTVWVREDHQFTPWLAQNLALLNEALGLEIELTGTEK